MPIYYFDVRDGKGHHRDEFGSECESFEDARQQAQSLLPEIARSELPYGEVYTISCDVRDETHRVVYRGKLTFEGARL